MKNITYHDRDYLRGNNLIMVIDEERVHFINGIAAVNALVVGRNEMYSGLINEEYQEAFDDKSQYGDINARKYLMFLRHNTNILRCGESDFIVTVRQGDEYHHSYANRHVRIKDMKATLINRDIGQYIKTNNENILITKSISSPYRYLYNITKGEYVKDGYDEISIIESYPNYFAVKKHIDSLIEVSSKDEDLFLSDDLYFQIDQDGHIISRVYSQRKLEFLNYGDINIDNYPIYRKHELIEESKKLKDVVHSLKYYKKENK